MARKRVRHLRADESCSKWNCVNRSGIYWGRSLRCTIHQEYRVVRIEPPPEPEPVSEPVRVEEQVKAAPGQLNLF